MRKIWGNIRSILRKIFGYGVEIYEIIPGLFQASSFTKKDIETIETLGIDVIIDLEGDIDRNIPGIKNIYWPIKDIAELPDLFKLDEIATTAAGYLQNGFGVMTHCSLGKNRSGLVNGVILVKMGFTGKEAVKLIQKKVPGALFNDTFRKYLEGAVKINSKRSSWRIMKLPFFLCRLFDKKSWGRP